MSSEEWTIVSSKKKVSVSDRLNTVACAEKNHNGQLHRQGGVPAVTLRKAEDVRKSKGKHSKEKYSGHKISGRVVVNKDGSTSQKQFGDKSSKYMDSSEKANGTPRSVYQQNEKIPRIPSTSNSNSMKDKPVGVTQTNPSLVSCSARSYGNSDGQTKQQRKVKDHEVPAEPKLQPGLGIAGGTTTTTKKKKKNVSKTERQRKREEKFFQALHQNKDSHIQFVSLDVIRKLQTDIRTPPSSQPKNVASASFVHRTPMPSTSWHCLNSSQTSEGLDMNFPSLTTPSTKRNKDDTSSWINVCTNQTGLIAHENENKVDILIDEAVQNGDKDVTSALSNAVPTPPIASKGRKSKQPMIIDVSTLIISSKKDKEIDRKNATNITPMKSGPSRDNHKVTLGNQLDSSGPGIMHRGKIRQKMKKPTKLKLSIMKSRALKRVLLEGIIKQETEKITSVAEISISMNENNALNVNNECRVKTEGIETPGKHTVSDETLLRVKLEDNDENHLIGLVECKHEGAESPKLNTSGGHLTPNLMSEPEPVLIKSEINSPTYLETDENPENSEITELCKPDVDSDSKFIQLLDDVTKLKFRDDELIPANIEVKTKALMHNRKFRDYCDMYTSKELHGHVIRLLGDLFKFQDRLYHSDPIKFKTKRRVISGLKDASTYLNLNKVQLLIIAPDVEINSEPGGLDDKMNQILNAARGLNVPYIFSGNKYILGKPIRMKSPASVVAVLDKQNCEDTFQAILHEANLLRAKYQNDFLARAKELISQDKATGSV